MLSILLLGRAKVSWGSVLGKEQDMFGLVLVVGDSFMLVFDVGVPVLMLCLLKGLDLMTGYMESMAVNTKILIKVWCFPGPVVSLSILLLYCTSLQASMGIITALLSIPSFLVSSYHRSQCRKLTELVIF